MTTRILIYVRNEITTSEDKDKDKGVKDNSLKHLIDSSNQFYDLLNPIVEEEGYALVKIAKEGSDRRGTTLNIMVEPETAETLNLDDCARLSRAMSAILDVEEPISGAYILEVGSAGVDRPLTRAKDFAAYVGYRIKLEAKRPQENGQKKFDSMLQAFDAETETITLNPREKNKDHEDEVTLTLADIRKAKLVFTEDLIKKSLKKETK